MAKQHNTRSLFEAPKDTPKRQWFKMETQPGTNALEILIYDEIGGWWGVDALELVQQINESTATEIQLRVNSPGGDVYGALAIMNALHRHPATVTATVDGLAASAASFIIQAADKVIMGRGTELMIHDALMLGFGNPADFREAAERLDKISDAIAAIYAERAGGTAVGWRELMTAETWYSAQEAVTAGLADEYLGKSEGEPRPEEELADAENRFDLSVFAHAGRSHAPSPLVPAATTRRRASAARFEALAIAAGIVNRATNQAPEPPVQTTTKEGADPMSVNLTQGLCQRLGLDPTNPENTADATLLAAVDEALAEQAEQAAPVASASMPAGTVVLDEVQHQQLVSDAAAGRAARDLQLEQDRFRAVDAAIADGRIPPARRAHWVNQLEVDPGAQATLDGLSKGLIPLAANGYTGGVNESSDDDSLYSKFWNDKEGK